MDVIGAVAETFAVGLAAALTVMLFGRFFGRKPNWRTMVAIPIGLAIAKGMQLQWSITDFVYPFVLGGFVGLSVLIAQFVGTTAKGDA